MYSAKGGQETQPIKLQETVRKKIWLCIPPPPFLVLYAGIPSVS